MDNPRTPSDAQRELDLYDLACVLWRNWHVIFAATVTTGLLAALYAFLATPIYQTSVQILPPSVSGVAHYNLVNQLISETINFTPEQDKTKLRGITVTPLTPPDAYRVFQRHLASDAVRQKFFSEVYLPTQGGEISESQIERLWSKLDKELKITLPARPEDATQLSLKGPNPADIAAWANDYVHSAITAAQKELTDDLAAFVDVRRRSNREQLAALRKVAAQTRANQMARVKDALQIAESVGLENASASGNLIIDYKDETMYLRGAKALRAELERLKLRENDDPYIPELKELQRIEAVLSSIDLNAENLSVAVVDRAAGTPVNPVSPQKALIIALGSILGLVASVLALLLHASVRRHA